MGCNGIHRLVLVGIRDVSEVPALQKGEEQRRHHCRAVDRLATRQAFDQCWPDEAWNLRETVHGNALVGITDCRVAEAVEHDIAIGRQVDRTGVLGPVEAGDDVVGDVGVRKAPDHRVVRSFVDVGHASQRARPGDAAVSRIENANLRFLVGLHRGDHLGANVLPGWAAGDKAVLDHPLDETLGHDRRVVSPSNGRRHALGNVGRRPRRDAIDHCIGAAGVGLDPARERVVAGQHDELHQSAARAVAVVAQVVAVEQRHRASAAVHSRAQYRSQHRVDRAAGTVGVL